MKSHKVPGRVRGGWRIAAAGAAVMLTLSGCGMTTASGVIEPVAGAETFCRVAKPITWSIHDTDDTIREVKAHNAVFVRLCGGANR